MEKFVEYETIFEHPYVFQRSEKTNEYHIFKVDSGTKRKEVINKESICGVSFNKSLDYDKSEDEEEARFHGAELGRKLCGNCIKNLYSNKATT